MADLLINKVPLPISRPLMEETIIGGSIDFKRPLQATEKAAGAFSEGGSYLPSLEGIKSLTGLLIESSGKIAFFSILVAVCLYLWRKYD